MIHFSNQGKIDPRVWTTFGVSVKETGNAIGQFGTGLKYAIAVLMREGRALSIKSGGDEYVFGVEQTDIRGKEFAQVTCNGDPMPFTTHLGSKWDLWQAYRELYSNCLDEGGHIGDGGETVIRAELDDIRHEDVFLEPDRSSRITSSSLCDVYPGQSYHLYYKGIRAMDLPTPSMFTYDLQRLDLTEDRTIKYMFEVSRGIAQAVLLCTCPDFVLRFLTQTKGWFEEDVSFDHNSDQPSDAVLECVQQYRKESIYKHKALQQKALERLGAAVYEFVPMDSRQAATVDRASSFCERIGHPITYPIKLATDLGSGTLAVADLRTKQIYLSDRVLTQGVKQVAATLIEENLHLKEGLQDCTYNMQTYLFDQIVTMGERLTGEVL